MTQTAVHRNPSATEPRPAVTDRCFPTLEHPAARNADVATQRATVTDINERLDTRKIVERAKGLLMVHQKLTEQDAFRLIQRTAMDRRSSMRDVASAITVKLAGAACATDPSSAAVSRFSTAAEGSRRASSCATGRVRFSPRT